MEMAMTDVRNGSDPDPVTSGIVAARGRRDRSAELSARSSRIDVTRLGARRASRCLVKRAFERAVCGLLTDKRSVGQDWRCLRRSSAPSSPGAWCAEATFDRRDGDASGTRHLIARKRAEDGANGVRSRAPAGVNLRRVRALDRIPLAILAGFLPKRYWDDIDLPVQNVALASALLTFFAGTALGITGSSSTWRYVLAQREWTAPPLMISVFISYVFVTPRGLFSLYLDGHRLHPRRRAGTPASRIGDPILDRPRRAWRRVRHDAARATRA